LLLLRCALYTSPKFPCIQTTCAVLTLLCNNYKSINLYCLVKFISIISKQQRLRIKQILLERPRPC
jgi:hypothetical protein